MLNKYGILLYHCYEKGDFFFINLDKYRYRNSIKKENRSCSVWDIIYSEIGGHKEYECIALCRKDMSLFGQFTSCLNHRRYPVIRIPIFVSKRKIFEHFL